MLFMMRAVLCLHIVHPALHAHLVSKLPFPATVWLSRYGLGITSVSPASGSLYGGSTLTITGYGFTPTAPSTATMGQLSAVTLSSSAPMGQAWMVGSGSVGGVNLTVLSATSTSLTFSVGRYSAMGTPALATSGLYLRIFSQAGAGVCVHSELGRVL